MSSSTGDPTPSAERLATIQEQGAASAAAAAARLLEESERPVRSPSPPSRASSSPVLSALRQPDFGHGLDLSPSSVGRENSFSQAPETYRSVDARREQAQRHPLVPRARRRSKEEESHKMTSLVNAAIDEIGSGPYQLIVLLLGGGVYMAEGSYLLMLSIVAKGLIAKWGLSPWTAGAMASILFGGLLVGTITGGFACDRFGRRMPVLVTYAGISIFTIVGILAPGIVALLVAKFLLGVFLGFGVPAANAIVAESCPPAQRSNIYCMTMVLFSLGQLYSATVVWFFSPTLHHDDMEWRYMLAASAILPMVLLVFALAFLEESPHWLMLNSRFREARVVAHSMLRWKKRDAPPDWLDSMQEAVDDQLRTPAPVTPYSCEDGGQEESTPLLRKRLEVASQALQEDNFVGKSKAALKESYSGILALFGPSYKETTLIMLFVTFASNFAYYGMIYGLPDTLKRAYMKDQAGWSPAAGLFLSAVSEIPGVFVAVVLGMTIGRRTNMTVAFLGCSLSLLGTVYAIHHESLTDNAGFVAVLGVKLFLATGYIIVYLYVLECYPTRFRATGLAFCMVLGRLGAAACPFVYDGLAMVLDTDVVFFLIMASLMGSASLACHFLPYETKDAALEEDAPPGTCTPVQEVAFRRKSLEGKL